MDKQPWELYELHEDPVELNDLADRMPEKVQTLARLWEDWAGQKAAEKRD